VREQLAAQGAEPVGSSPAEFAKFLRSESDKWAGVIKSAGVKAE
jgi:tripartite-type tricarboxylate transporter receptor subunit TctC